ncbi:MAG: Uma2 family endonuclease [Saprospiraceae bacterium]|nr:Uma2 family endonuclease [Saprospiraceae bacterium]
MVAIAAQHKSVNPAAPSIQEKKEPKRISWEEFQRKYLSREDSYKYEWVDGEVEKTKRTMDYNQFNIVRNLVNLFNKLLALGKTSGMLMPEGDIFFLGNHRRPDISWLSEEQIDRTAYHENQVPRFVVEVISNKDQMNLVHKKMQDYRAAGVEVVWHVFPQIEEVHVYSGKGLKKMTVCQQADLCSAATVIDGFEISVNDIFKKPAKPE